MTKLERLLKEMDYQNCNGTMADYEQASHRVAQWIYVLWKHGKLDPSQIKEATK